MFQSFHVLPEANKNHISLKSNRICPDANFAGFRKRAPGANIETAAVKGTFDGATLEVSERKLCVSMSADAIRRSIAIRQSVKDETTITHCDLKHRLCDEV